MKKLHLIWDMDGTLVNSEPEILSTIKKSLAQVGVPMEAATSKLRIGPPVKEVIRNAFTEDVLSEEQLDKAVKAFRVIYDSSDYEDTKPFDGIDELMYDPRYVHYIITNKPFYATNRILEQKGWNGRIVDVITPDSLMEVLGRKLTKSEMFKYCRSTYPEIPMYGIGDMALDAKSAIESGIQAIGVLWGTGTRDELEEAGCSFIVENCNQLKDILESL